MNYINIYKKNKNVIDNDEKKLLRIINENKSKKDGLLYPPKTSYNIYLICKNKSINELKLQFKYIINKLNNIGTDNINIFNCGLRKLIKPINNNYEALFILIELNIYPSIINLLRIKFNSTKNILRVFILKNQYKDKNRRIYRDSFLHIRHPYFNTNLYKNLKYKLLPPNENILEATNYRKDLYLSYLQHKNLNNTEFQSNN